ncbi:hypothetical protein FVEN_g11827 [Fusarium venenatum]|uniref:Uncharacterized protein n=1 Tax=Fusarium venenatum TaxID=56646 RepID=A0A2L2U065_9HYPO|nr:uncharacterized protein FVRRES_08297 [Fusarium venenatum]KAG8349984.1 hypothetical protein FVEN_g11827 [Fusarium venenatum]KAH6965084.1 hypothetical protein EDB82DRAFT_528820 [Fusarium venenatum]CEI68220.1 unnamed protein product [Fusarium venenatum]
MNSLHGSASRRDKTSSDLTKDDKPVVDKDRSSPLLDWLNQNEGDDPWHGFTAVSTEGPRGRSQDGPAKDKTNAWSTQAEVGSDRGE